MSLINDATGRNAADAVNSRRPHTVSFRTTVAVGESAEVVAGDTPPDGVKTRPELTVPISPGPALTDTVLYEDPAVPDRRYYLPRYRLAEETVSGRQQYRLALRRRGPQWAFTVVLEKFPAAEIELEARTARELPHDLHVVLTHRLFMNGVATGVKERGPAELEALSNGIQATIALETLEERDEVYRALTEGTYTANLEVRRGIRAAVLVPPGDAGIYTVSRGGIQLNPGDAFDVVAGVPAGEAAHLEWAGQRIVPRRDIEIARLGVVPLEPIAVEQLRGAPYTREPLQCAAVPGPDALVLITSHWNPPSGGGGVYVKHPQGVWYTGAVWSIFNQDLQPMDVNSAYVVVIAAQGAFLHRAVANVNISGNWTSLEHPALNGNPAALCQITQNWNPPGGGGTYNPHHVAVWYTGSHWAIYNQDMAAMTPGAAFNIRVTPAGPRSFLHRALPDNIQGHVTNIHHPQLDGRPDQKLLATPNWNPGGGGGVYNNHAIGVYYTGANWAIYNQDIAPMPPNAAFNVEIVEAPEAFVHVAVAATDSGNTTLLSVPAPEGAISNGHSIAVRAEAQQFAKLVIADCRTALTLQWMTVSDAPRYREEAASLDLTRIRESWVFPPNLYGYIFRDIDDVGGGGGLVRHSVEWEGVQHPYYQDGTRRETFYYLPDAFKVARKSGVRRTPEITVRVGSPDGSLEKAAASIAYLAVAVTDPQRLRAAKERLRSVLDSEAGEPLFEPIRPQALVFKLGLPRPQSTAVAFVVQPDALVSMSSVRHSTEQPIESFQAVFESLFTQSSLIFQGQIEVTLGEEVVPPIPFQARINDLAGDPVICTVSRDGASMPVVLRNVIESGVRIHELVVTLLDGPARLPATVEGLSLPIDVAASQQIAFSVRPAAGTTPSAASAAEFDFRQVEVLPDRPAVFDAVVDTSIAPEYLRNIRVRTVREVFQGEDPKVTLIRVNLQRAESAVVSVDLTEDHLDDVARLRAPLRDYILGRADRGEFQYHVVVIRGGMRTISSIKTATTDLIITTEDFA